MNITDSRFFDHADKTRWVNTTPDTYTRCRREVDAANRIRIKNTEKRKLVAVRDAVRRAQVPNGIIQQPTASEVFGLSFGSRSATNAQELRNEFARLLNRGSSLE